MTPIHRGGAPLLNCYRGGSPVLRIFRGSALAWEPAPTLMPAQLRGTSSATVVSTTTNKTIGRPSGVAQGDLLIFVLATYGTSANSSALPSGFTQIATHDRNTSHNVKMGWKLATSSEPTTYTPTIPSGNSHRADILAYYDADSTKLGTPVIGTTTASSTSHNAPSITPTTDHGILLCLVSGGGGNEWTPPTGMTERTDSQTAASHYLTLSTADQTVTSNAATGTRTFGGGGGTYSQTTASIFIPSKKGWGGGGTPTPTPTPTTALKPTNFTQTQMDGHIQTLWNTWKALLRQDTTQGWYAVFANAQGGENPYVAEGQGYGMMLAAQMAPYDPAARTIFDGLTKFVLDHPSAIDPDLTAAQQDLNMVTRGGGDSATDGDLDITMGLLQAHDRWGSTGTYNYLELARTRIAAIKRSLISPSTGLLELGDWSADYTGSGGNNWLVVSRPSDWMIGHLEAFKRATGDTAWDTILSDHLTAVARIQGTYSPTTGLMPDFTIGPPATVAPAGANTLEGPNDGNYYYNACRTPWRFGAAANTAARAAAAQMSLWARDKCGGNPATMPTGYTLDGLTSIGTYQDLAFISPFAVGATWGGDQTWLNSLWTYMSQNTGNTDYYSSSIQLMCMIRISGTYLITPTGTSGTPTTTLAGAPTNGSGGSKTNQTGITLQATQGARVSSLYHRYAAHLTGDGPYPLVIHLHGDGGYEYYNPTIWTSPLYMDVARSINGIGIIPLTPDTTSGYRRWWEGYEPTYWLVDLIAELKRTFNVDTNRIFISGFSGGAVVTTTNLVADWPEIFGGGGAMMLGGGGAYTAATTPTATLQSRFLMRWHVGSSDEGVNDDGTIADDGYNALAAAQAGEQKYRTDGWNTRITYIAGEDHLQSENDGPAALQSLVDEFRTSFGF